MEAPPLAGAGATAAACVVMRRLFAATQLRDMCCFELVLLAAGPATHVTCDGVT